MMRVEPSARTPNELALERAPWCNACAIHGALASRTPSEKKLPPTRPIAGSGARVPPAATSANCWSSAQLACARPHVARCPYDVVTRVPSSPSSASAPCDQYTLLSRSAYCRATLLVRELVSMTLPSESLPGLAPPRRPLLLPVLFVVTDAENTALPMRRQPPAPNIRSCVGSVRAALSRCPPHTQTPPAPYANERFASPSSAFDDSVTSGPAVRSAAPATSRRRCL